MVFQLEVVAGAATGLTIYGGDGQSTQPYEPFGSNLKVRVANSAGAPVQGEAVAFTIQGATGTRFADNTVQPR